MLIKEKKHLNPKENEYVVSKEDSITAENNGVEVIHNANVPSSKSIDISSGEISHKDLENVKELNDHQNRKTGLDEGTSKETGEVLSRPTAEHPLIRNGNLRREYDRDVPKDSDAIGQSKSNPSVDHSGNLDREYDRREHVGEAHNEMVCADKREEEFQPRAVEEQITSNMPANFRTDDALDVKTKVVRTIEATVPETKAILKQSLDKVAKEKVKGKQRKTVTNPIDSYTTRYGRVIKLTPKRIFDIIKKIPI